MATFDLDSILPHANACAEFSQCDFCVITGKDGLVHGCHALRLQSCQQHARFHLGAGNRQGEVDGVKGTAQDF